MSLNRFATFTVVSAVKNSIVDVVKIKNVHENSRLSEVCVYIPGRMHHRLTSVSHTAPRAFALLLNSYGKSKYIGSASNEDRCRRNTCRHKLLGCTAVPSRRAFEESLLKRFLNIAIISFTVYKDNSFVVFMNYFDLLLLILYFSLSSFQAFSLPLSIRWYAAILFLIFNFILFYSIIEK